MDLYRIKDFLTDLFFPNRCPFCQKFIKWDKLSCDECFEKIEWVSDNDFDTTDMNFDVCFTAAFYSGVSKRAILNLKSNLETGFVRIMASELASKLYEHGYDNADYIIPVPMTRKKLKRIGFNHSEVICDELAKCLGKSTNNDILFKNNNDTEQHTINAKERAENVKGMFYLNNSVTLDGKTVIICDDVITTGATMNECAKLMREKGAKTVIAVSATKNA